MTIEEVIATSRASQNKLELGKLLKWVDEIHPSVILEIGTHLGYSMEVWQKSWPTSSIIGIGNEPVDPALKESLNVVYGDSHQDTTREMVDHWLLGRPVDFLFIDGDHTYEGVKNDYLMYSPLVRHGGIIGFHDIALDGNKWRMAGVDVRRFWDELIGKAGSKYYIFWDEIGKGTGTGLFYKP